MRTQLRQSTSPSRPHHLQCGTVATAILATVILVLLASGCAGLQLREQAAPRPLDGIRIGAALPRFTTETAATGRDGGNSVRIGDEILWVFGDTFVGNETMLSATAAWSSRDNPTSLRDGAKTGRANPPSPPEPEPFYVATAKEQQFNDAHQSPPACCQQSNRCDAADRYCHCDDGEDCRVRIALWPGDSVAVSESTAINLYEAVMVGAAPYDFEVLGTGLAQIEYGQTQSRRSINDAGAPLLLFENTEPKFLTALPSGTDPTSPVYLYGQRRHPGCMADFWVARTRLGEMTDRATYRFWNGHAWTPKLDNATPILKGVAGGLDSVAWVPALGSYIGASLGGCTGGATLELRTAARPEGPWSAPKSIDLSAVGAGADAYAGRLHPALSHGQRLVVGFYQPREEANAVLGEVRLAELILPQIQLPIRHKQSSFWNWRRH
jgi:hypothetical protein